MRGGVDNNGFVSSSNNGSAASVNEDPEGNNVELRNWITNGKNYEPSPLDTSFHTNDRMDDNPEKSSITSGGNWLGNSMMKIRNIATGVRSRHQLAFHRGVIICLHVCVLAYVAGASSHWFIHAGGSRGEPVDFCDGLGMVYIIAGILYLGLLYFQIIKPYFGRKIYKAVLKPIGMQFDKYWEYIWFRLVIYLVLIGGIITYLVLDTATERDRLISCSGVVILMLLGFIFSKHPGHVRWRPVFWGLGLQFAFGLLTIRWTFGRAVLECVGGKVTTFLAYTDEGSSMVYGEQLVTQWQVFAFKVLPVIFFFSFCIQILYYYGAMQWLVLKIGWLLQVTLGTTVCESVNTAASIFLGQSESPLLIKPYIHLLTRSELHAIMTGGFATIAGTVMAAYLSFGVDASHLITASVMSAPAALCYSKLFYPETEESKTQASDIQITKGDETSALDAASKGASDGVQLIMGIIANLIAFVAFVAFLNGIISWFGSHVGAEYLTFEWILSKVFIPLAYVMGVKWCECEDVATLIGLKTVVNEFVAYERLGIFMAEGRLAPRSEAIATYALCGFANPSSIGIMIGALSFMAPNKRGQIAEVAFRAFIAGSAACFLTACVAGTLLDSSDLVSSSNATYIPRC